MLKVEDIAQSKGRLRQKLEKQHAFTRLCRETDEDILTATDFKLLDPTHGPEAWEHLRTLTVQMPELPLRFVEYYKSSYALLGNVAAASELVVDPAIKRILRESSL